MVSAQKTAIGLASWLAVRAGVATMETQMAQSFTAEWKHVCTRRPLVEFNDGEGQLAPASRLV